MPRPPYSDHDFYESDWGSIEAAYAAAKVMFEQKRTAKGEPLVNAYRADGVASSRTVLLNSFSKPTNKSGSERTRGWTVREPNSIPLTSRERPKK